MTDNMGSMGDVAKYGGTAQITGEDMRRRNEDNAKVNAACVAEAEDWAARDIFGASRAFDAASRTPDHFTQWQDQ